MRWPWISGALLALLALAACDQQPQAADGYSFEPESQMIDPRPIVVVTYPDTRALKAAYAQQRTGRKLGDEDLFAFAVIKPDVCVIHQIRPSTVYRPEEYGHELAHCLYGDWHPNQNERT